MYVLFSTLFAFAHLSIAQIKTYDGPPTTPQRYDSSSRYIDVDHIGLLKGQALYFPPRIEKADYEHIYQSYLEKSVYQPGADPRLSRYDAIAGKYFRIHDIVERKEIYDDNRTHSNSHPYYFKLKDKTGGNAIYYHITTNGIKTHSFSPTYPFIIVGLYEKIKKDWLNKVIVLVDSYKKNFTDRITKQPISVLTGERWTCTDVVVAPYTEELTYNNEHLIALILKSDHGTEIMVNHSWLTDENVNSRSPRIYYTEAEASEYEHKLGQKHWLAMLTRTPQIGMSPEMCRLMFGPAKDEALSAVKNKQILVQRYWNYILQFENGKLKAIRKLEKN
ncbi:hypothetical protein GCM10009415_26760 [Chitinophaga japonensis]